MSFIGKIIDFNEFEELVKTEKNYLVVMCSKHKQIKRTYSSFSVVKISEVLSKELLKYRKEQRLINLSNELDRIIAMSKSNKLIIKDFDILFNPYYKIDVLKWMINISRNKKVIVLWNGILEKQSLIYSENGYLDYKSYNLKNYEVFCVN